MGRKNRRRSGRELEQEVVRDIVTGTKTLYVEKKEEFTEGMRVEDVFVDEPVRASEADRLYKAAVEACTRIIGELDEELRRHHHEGEST